LEIMQLRLILDDFSKVIKLKKCTKMLGIESDRCDVRMAT